MWLLNARTKDLEQFVDERVEPYAILSHTWGNGEVTFQDVQNGCAKSREAYGKITQTCHEALKDGLSYVWIDTCCINKESSAELSEAINSMFRWYSAAAMCYVYLFDAVEAVKAYDRADVDGRGLQTSHGSFIDPRDMSPYSLIVYEKDVYDDLCLDTCKWFTRGWTLQELIAPEDIAFFGPEWQPLGTKRSLIGNIAEITKINPAVLKDRRLLSQVTIASRMSWAALRQTSRIEDRAYSMLGIFDISMPMLYGEGDKAFVRLQEEIIRRSTDQSIFAWTPDETRNEHALLASSPDDFGACENISFWATGANTSYHLSNRGLEICLPVLEPNHERGTHNAILNCCLNSASTGPLGICLEQSRHSAPVEDWKQHAAQSEFSVGSNSDTGLRLTVLPSDLTQATHKLITILRHPQVTQKPLGWMGDSKSPDEIVLLALRPGIAGNSPSHDITPLKRLSNESFGQYQVFTPNKSNQVSCPHVHHSPLINGHRVIHEAYAMWQVTVELTRRHQFAVALRLS